MYKYDIILICETIACENTTLYTDDTCLPYIIFWEALVS